MIRTRTLFGAVLAALVLSTSAAVADQSGAVQFSGTLGPFAREQANVAVPAYHVTFITQQQGTAAGNIEARARLNAVLAGIDEATMRRLTNEAYADLITRLQAANLAVVPAAQARALANGVDDVPGNGDVKGVGAGITIGRSVRRGYASYGADEAPMLVPYHNPTGATGGPNLMRVMGAANTIGRAAREIDAWAVIPALTIDFINMEARRTSSSASVSSEVVFSLRMASGASTAGRGAAGPGYMQGLRMTRDVTWTDTFAEVIQGGAAVREGTMTPIINENYQVEARARGDAIVADAGVWEELVRQAYRTFNEALVAEIVEARS
jgi:hypothetical protein